MTKTLGNIQERLRIKSPQTNRALNKTDNLMFPCRIRGRGMQGQRAHMAYQNPQIQNATF